MAIIKESFIKFSKYAESSFTGTIGSINCGSNDNRLLLVFIPWRFGNNFPPYYQKGTLYYNNVALTHYRTYGAGNGGISIYYLLNPSVGTNSLKAENFSIRNDGGSVASITFAAYALSGVDISSTIENAINKIDYETTDYTITQPSITLTTTKPNTFMISAYGGFDTGSSSVTTGGTDEVTDDNGISTSYDIIWGFSHKTLENSGDYTTSKTTPGSTGVLVAMAINPAPTVPIVTTSAATNIDKESFTGNGNITDTGGANATERGFCYKVGTSGDPTTSDSKVYDSGSFSTGSFSKSITGLEPNTSYRVRAYAINTAGTGYGSTVDVKTLPSSNFFLFFN